MDDKTEVIRHNIEETRHSLADKLETLEQTVVETVQGTTCAVAETVDTVKEAVQETVEQVKETVQTTVEKVKETFDLRLQVERHPWLMLGGSVGVGYLAGTLLTPATGAPPCPTATAEEPQAVNYLGERLKGSTRSNGAKSTSYAAVEESAPKAAGGLMSIFGCELEKLKKLAIGTVLGLVHDLIEKNLKGDLGHHLTDMVDDLNSKLGGERVRGTFFQNLHNGAHHGNGHEGADQSTTGNA
jgi:ElaB/YqjD/DUF883 family membrane-anchored ribosome-binding protein